MRISRAFYLMLALTSTWWVAGCAPMAVTGAPDLDKTAFGAKKKFAVVSIAALKTFQGERALGDGFKSADDVPGANTQPLIDKLEPKIIHALSHSGHFYLLPESRVLHSRAYKQITEDEKVTKVLFITADMNVARNYKYISDPQKYAKLAKDLGVDGVIGITMNFGISSGGSRFGINGLNFGKKTYSATAGISAVAYNQNGEIVWKDSTIKEAEPDDSKAIIVIDTGAFTGADFEKMQPSAVVIGGKAVDVLLARFDDALAGKTVESVQSMK